MAISLEYLNAAMAKAKYEQMEDGRFFATIPKFDGLWAVGRTRDEATKELYSALDGWLHVQTKFSKEPPPAIGGVDFSKIPRSTPS